MRTLIKKTLIIFSSIIVIFALALWLYYILQIRPPVEYKTLSEISAYADALPEFPKSEDNDWLNPNYQEFYTKRTFGRLQPIFEKIGFKKNVPWSPLYMADMVKYLTKQNNDFGLINGEKSFIHIKALKKTKFHIFGNLNGAFHSLIRDLKYLKQQGIIDEDLKVLDEESYLVINGNSINRSPYGIDTLILIATLLKKNPLNVFYVPGDIERNSLWLDSGLKKELVIRGKSFSNQPVPFRTELDSFFRTLPEAIYVSEFKDSVIRIAYCEQKDLSYDEANLSTSFLKQDERVLAHTFMDKKPKEPSLNVLVAIGTENWRTPSRIKHGLGLLDQDQGATFWAVLSSPIYVNELYLNFYDDAFAHIEIQGEIETATISRVFRDVRTKNNFQEDEKLNIVFARPMNSPPIKNLLKVASTMSLGPGVHTVGRQVEMGLNVKVNQFNLSDKNIGTNMRLYIDNDNYVPRLALSNVAKFINHGIKFLMLPIGAPSTLSFLKIAEENDLAILFPVTGSSDLRKASIKNIIHFRGSYEDEIRVLISTLVKDYGSMNFAFFYQDDSFGRPAFLAAVKELKRYGISNPLGLAYSRTGISFETQIRKFKESQADSLGFFSTGYATMELIRQMGVTELANTQLFGISFVGAIRFRNFMKKHGLDILLSAVVPNPKVNQSEMAKSYRKEVNKINGIFDVFSFEAYISTSIFLHAVESLGEKPLSVHNIMSAMEAMKNVNFKGIMLNYNKNKRSLAEHVWLETSENENWPEYAIE